MNIKNVKTAFKVADVVLDKEHPKNHIKLNYLPEIINEKGEKTDNNVLKDRKGLVYLIVVDGEIKKIGGSQGKGGIKSTMSFYQAAMQGRPSIRSYGIHMHMKESLDSGCNVEIYIINANEITGPVKGLFSEDEGVKKIAVFKEMEDKCKEDFISEEGKYPEWNYQEQGFPWPTSVQEKHNQYLATTIKKEKKS